MTPLERGQLSVMRTHALLFGAIVLALAFAAELVLQTAVEWLPLGVVAMPAALLLAWPVFIGPARRFRAWGYAVGADELHLRHGVLIEVDTVVPYGRVQHIDVAQGPIERSFGVSRLVLHTAGTANSAVVLPGLSRAAAEALRDEIRTHIRQDLG